MSQRPSEPASRFRLTAGEKDSPTWTRLSKRINERISTLQRTLESPQEEAKSAYLRGQIAELRLLASAAEDDPPPIDD